MAVSVLLELNVKPDQVEAVKSSLKAHLPDTRAYDGCNGLTVHANQGENTNLVLISQWDSRQHYERYFAWREETGMIEEMGTLLSAPPSIRCLDLVDA